MIAPITGMGYVNIYGQDITKRKQAEMALQEANEELEVVAEELRQQNDELMSVQSALRENEEKYRTIVETAHEGIWAVDSKTRTIYVNRRMAEMLGYSPEEILGKKSSEFMDEEGRARLSLLLEHRRQGINESFEFKFIRKDGLPLWAISSAAPLRDKEGKFVGSLGMLTDITERKRAEEALLENEERYATTLASIGDAVIATDIEGRITFMNAVAEGLTGWTLDEASMKPAKKVFNIINEYTRNKVDDPIIKVLENGVIVGLANHTILVRRDGTEVAIDDSGAPIKDLAGNTIGVVLVFRDITERKRAEEELFKARNDLELKVQERTAELQKAMEAANESARAKAAFLANMSHELRTPMNAVIGFSSLLLDDSLTPEHREYIEGIRKGGGALLAIIDDILDFSKAENDKLELEHQPFSLKHCIDESLGMVATQAGKKGLNLSETINYGTPDTIIGDHGRLRQILVNLLTNSVKFTDKGDISVSVSSKAVEGNEHLVYFAVKDTGIGIPQDKMNELFEPFVQVERTLSRKRDGVGLGLAITKNLVELMGGKIWAESIPGQGSTFHFSIQVETIPGKQLGFGKIDLGATSESFPGLKPMRILVAEDNPSNQRVLVEMLKILGYRADAVADGREVIQALERQDYDLVLMDIKMPEMDGITATQVIRKTRPEDGPKIIAITAFALEGDREKCLEAGMDDYIAKPVKIAELADILRKY
ncbi:Methyl sulfide methyltransferase-associated sensor [uncultured archaeon]|nr:Methyl sulfide methyltransferase-associated sensor [uncultured archaeon]